MRIDERTLPIADQGRVILERLRAIPAPERLAGIRFWLEELERRPERGTARLAPADMAVLEALAREGAMVLTRGDGGRDATGTAQDFAAYLVHTLRSHLFSADDSRQRAVWAALSEAADVAAADAKLYIGHFWKCTPAERARAGRTREFMRAAGRVSVEDLPGERDAGTLTIRPAIDG